MAQSEKNGEPQRTPRWPNRRNKSTISWLQYGYSKTKQDGRLAPRCHRVRACGAHREDQDGPQEAVRGPAIGAKTLIQREGKMDKVAYRWHRIVTSGALREDRDGPA